MAGIGTNNWYKKNLIDRIFGQENLTEYIQNNGGHMCHPITDEFRSYVSTFYPDKYTFFRNTVLKKEIFDKDTHTFIKQDEEEWQ